MFLLSGKNRAGYNSLIVKYTLCTATESEKESQIHQDINNLLNYSISPKD